MTMPYAERLAEAQRLYDNRTEISATTPVAYRDQVDAAGSEALDILNQKARKIDFLSRRIETEIVGESAAVALMAALMVCHKCLHCSPNPEPIMVFLPYHLMAPTQCQCVETHDRVVADNLCDLCEEEIPDLRFMPVAIALGPFTFVGDICVSCAGVVAVAP